MILYCLFKIHKESYLDVKIHDNIYTKDGWLSNLCDFDSQMNLMFINVSQAYLTIIF